MNIAHKRKSSNALMMHGSTWSWGKGDELHISLWTIGKSGCQKSLNPLTLNLA